MSSKQLRIATIVLLCILILSSCAAAEETATVHGSLYNWYTLEPQEDVILEINTTPAQTVVANNGIYAFTLEPGSYLIEARGYENSTLTAYSEEEITIKKQGDYVIDILLYPVYEEDIEDLNDTELNNLTASVEEGTKIVEETSDDQDNYSYFLILIIPLLIVAIYFYRRKREENGKNSVTTIPDLSDAEQTPEVAPSGEIPHEVKPEEEDKNEEELPADLKEILAIIQKAGGRITQKDLRQKLNCSEAKASLMIADLQRRGLIDKFKKGRGNILVLKN
ncbi:winged helix-turn-helix transcriptional regulator [Methanohalophilus sp. RSK]|uniref:helix-turn-helix transcriptional regulator n=1 Tax=Methanohalophilus sp. RSK TaxID=2485783 RepID=UPI000F43A283|nr:winged helix-turn-helix transcriptional regulator [Methanohalophilus sp. RSK]RNI12913.1 winged helix-turn-helix transcriptional regulator [Methanohalophilus sp. RSK]